jgi:hypothetical protein
MREVAGGWVAVGAVVLLLLLALGCCFSWLLVCLATSGWMAEKWRLRLQGGKRKQSQTEELLAGPEQVAVELR